MLSCFHLETIKTLGQGALRFSSNPVFKFSTSNLGSLALGGLIWRQGGTALAVVFALVVL